MGCQAREPGSRWGVRAFIGPARIYGVFTSHASAGQRGLSDEGLNRTGEGRGLGSGRLESVE